MPILALLCRNCNQPIHDSGGEAFSISIEALDYSPSQQRVVVFTLRNIISASQMVRDRGVLPADSPQHYTRTVQMLLVTRLFAMLAQNASSGSGFGATRYRGQLIELFLLVRRDQELEPDASEFETLSSKRRKMIMMLCSFGYLLNRHQG